MTYHKNDVSLDVKIKRVGIKHSETVRYLGVLIDKDMRWNSQIIHFTHVISRNIGIICRSKYFVPKKHRLLLYNSLVLPYFNNCCLLWGYSTKKTNKQTLHSSEKSNTCD